MAQTTSGFQIWRPEIDAYIQDELQNQPESLYSKVFTVATTDRLQINEITYSGANPMQVVGELGDAVEDDDLEGYKVSYSRADLRTMKTFSADLMQTDQVGKAEEMARDLARLPEYTRNMRLFGVFRNMANALYTGGDGKTLLSTLHPIKDGSGTQSNTFADAVQKPMSYANVKELQDVLISNVSNKGNLLNIGAPGKNKVIWCASPLRMKAFEIAGAGIRDERPDTPERATNYFVKGDKFDVLVIQYVNYEAARKMGETTVAKTSSSNYWDSMWGLLDIDVVKRYFKMYVQTGYAKFTDEIKQSNEALIKYVYDAYAYGFTNWLGFAGSLGDNSTLSI